MRQGVDFKWYVYHVCSLQSLFLLFHILVVQSNVQDASYLITPAQCLGLLHLDHISFVELACRCSSCSSYHF